MTTEIDPDTLTNELVSEEEEEFDSPREMESALLSVALFGGLIVFAFGCTMLW